MRNVLATFKVAVDRASFVLKEMPELTFPQVFNRIQPWADEHSRVHEVLRRARATFARPWFRVISGPQASPALVRTIRSPGHITRHCVFNQAGDQVFTTGGSSLRAWDVHSGMGRAEMRGHTDSILACQLGPNPQTVLTHSRDHTIRIWDPSTGTELKTIKIVGQNPTSSTIWFCNGVAVFERGDFGRERHDLIILDLESGSELETLEGHSDYVIDCAFSPDGTRLATAGNDGTLRLWELGSGGRNRVLLHGHSTAVVRCAFSPDAKQLLFYAHGEGLMILDPDSGLERRRIEIPDEPLGFQFLPDSRRIVSDHEGGTLRIWDSWTGDRLAVLRGHTGRVNSVLISRDGMLILSGSRDASIRVWHTETMTLTAILRGHSGDVVSCALGPDGKTLASVSEGPLGIGMSSGELILWDLSEIQPGCSAVSASESSHAAWVSASAFSSDGRRFATGSHDMTLKLWDGAKGDEIATLRGHRNDVFSCEFSPDSETLLSSSTELKSWNAEDGRALSTLEGHTYGILACAYSHDGELIVSGSQDKTLRVWDARSGVLLHVLSGHGDSVEDCAFSPDDRMIASASRDRTVGLWNARKGKRIKTLAGKNSMFTCSFSPDGKSIAAGSYRHVTIWNIDGRTEVNSRGFHGEDVKVCAFSPDGGNIVSTGRENVLRLWDPRTGEEVRQLEGHGGPIRTVAYSPDGLSLVSGGDDGSLRLWSAKTGMQLAIFTGVVAGVTTCAFSPDSRRVVVGDAVGKVFLVAVENVETGSTIVTAWAESHGRVFFRRTKDFVYRCPRCVRMHEIPKAQLGEDTTCDACGQRVRLNPFATEH